MNTLILIPGLLCDDFVWQGILTHLPANTYIADNTKQNSISEMAQSCLEETNGKLRIAGHSMGARVALEMIRLAPERIEKMALLDTGIHGLKDGETEKRRAIIDFAYEHGMKALSQKATTTLIDHLMVAILKTTQMFTHIQQILKTISQ